jgi:tRNA-dihydrouridine synthase
MTQLHDRAAAIRPIVLRGLTLANNLVMAPLAGVSNLPFRLIAREAGASLAFTETVSGKGLVNGGRVDLVEPGHKLGHQRIVEGG